MDQSVSRRTRLAVAELSAVSPDCQLLVQNCQPDDTDCQPLIQKFGSYSGQLAASPYMSVSWGRLLAVGPDISAVSPICSAVDLEMYTAQKSCVDLLNNYFCASLAVFHGTCNYCGKLRVISMKFAYFAQEAPSECGHHSVPK